MFRLFFSDLLRFATASDRSSDIVYFLISFFNRLRLFPKVIKIKISALHVSVCVSGDERKSALVINGGEKITNPYKVLRCREKQMALFMEKERKCLWKDIEYRNPDITKQDGDIYTQQTNLQIN